MKTKSITNLNKKYKEIVNKYLSYDGKSSDEISIINGQLSAIIQIMEREESLPAGLINGTVILGLLIPIVTPFIPIIIDYIQKVIL